LSQEEMKTAVSRALKSLEVVRLLKELKKAGMDVEYRSCDVVDEDQVGMLVRDLVRLYGKVDGIIHGAGAISDGLLMNLTAADFSAVADVKLHGAWNLFKAAEKCGLRFFTVLSSVVAAVGNPGQANYCAAGRAVSALVKMLGRSNGRVRCTSLLLPPIAGAGMADNPAIRELMRIKGMEDAYIDVSELKELFCREFVTVPTVSDTVLFMRKLPAVPTARLNATDPPPDSEALRVGTVNFRRQDFPLIDSVPRCDVGSGTLEAHRTFSMEKDLWIADHKPFKFLRNPLVSGVMVVEAFMEAARLLYPYLQVQGIQRAQFLDRLECPSARERFTVIACTRIHSENRQVICEASFSSQDLAPLESQPVRMRLNHKAHIILSGLTEYPRDPLAGFPVSPSELDSPAVSGDEILKLYEEKYDFKGRYRVLSYVEGAGAGVIRGRTIYREGKDFSAHPITHYQYSPYLLEAVFHLVAYHVMMTHGEDSRPVVPFEIRELMLHRKARHGEEVLLEG
jgi:NAD(P)-dependent dehydrogenase (short-subunit alcohol dehydrogenase family)